MFRALVAHRVRVAWSQLARGDYGYVLDQLAPSFTHSFAGDHALGGERRSREAQRAWFQRLFRLLPGVEFILDEARAAPISDHEPRVSGSEQQRVAR